ncbi:MAG: hypothetical protein QOF89_123 [Acidobacteriota bacterium]|jgi:anti-sigma factor RsiW|nr:hypothetical protein [Acidobacteriota bacterium]
MTRGTDNDLISLLHGELPAAEARELQVRLLREPELAAAYARLERTWRGLEPPPAAPVPPGFTGRVMARVRSERSPATSSGSLSWTAAPGWVRATAAAALLAGAALGIGVGRSWPASELATNATPETATAALSNPGEDLSLAAGYWSLVDDETTATPGVETEGRP